MRVRLLTQLFIATCLTVLFTGTVFADVSLKDIKTPEDVGDFKDYPGYEDRLPLYEKLNEENNHTVGWIYIDGTKVDNVLMQNVEEKDFYIDKGFDREYYYPGTLYISDISDVTIPSDVVVLYGHNMKDRSMFGSLREYEDPEFLKKHNWITLDNLKERLEYEITHVMRIRVNVEGGDVFPYYTYSNFEDKAAFDEFIEQCNEHVLYDSGKSVKYGDKFVMLTTCEYTYSDGTGRLVVMGRISEEPVEIAVTTCSAVTEPEAWPYLNHVLIGGGAILAVLLIILVMALKKRK